MYVLHEVAFSASENRDEQRVQFPGGPSNVLGRCFIEVSLRERCPTVLEKTSNGGNI